MNIKSLREQYVVEEIFSDFNEQWKINAPKSEERLNKDGLKKSYRRSHIMAVLKKCQMRIGN